MEIFKSALVYLEVRNLKYHTSRYHVDYRKHGNYKKSMNGEI